MPIPATYRPLDCIPHQIGLSFRQLHHGVARALALGGGCRGGGTATVASNAVNRRRRRYGAPLPRCTRAPGPGCTRRLCPGCTRNVGNLRRAECFCTCTVPGNALTAASRVPVQRWKPAQGRVFLHQYVEPEPPVANEGPCFMSRTGIAK